MSRGRSRAPSPPRKAAVRAAAAAGAPDSARSRAVIDCDHPLSLVGTCSYTIGMSTSPSARGPQLERRDRFRNYMRSFNPTAPARNVIAAGLVYEELHHKLYSNLAGRADLEPGSQQLLVGGIGSGKTVELLLAAQWFTREVDGLVLYIDITAETDLSGLNSGSLLASFGVHLARRVSHDKAVPKRDLEAITQRIREYAYGKKQKVWVSLDDEDWEPESDGDEEGDENRGYFTFREIPGKLKPPLPVLRRDVREISKPLEELLAASKSFYKIFSWSSTDWTGCSLQ